jgi:hypothetical protein
MRSRVDAPPGAAGRPARYCELAPEDAAAATAQREALGVSLRPGPLHPPSSAQLRLMRDRLHQCAQVSGFVLELRQATAAAGVLDRPDHWLADSRLQAEVLETGKPQKARKGRRTSARRR